MHSKNICNPGRRYGNLIVLDRDFNQEEENVAKGRQRRPYYHCVCNCGNEKTVCGYDLLSGNTTSCGCAKAAHKTKRKPEGMRGMEFGNLSVLHRDDSTEYGAGRHIKWICRCNLCGSTKSLRGSDLRSGKATDCGCFSRIRGYDGLSDDLTGFIFGYLQAVERDSLFGHKAGQHTKWTCVCLICGRSESVRSDLLKSGQKIMCHSCCKKSAGEKKISELLEGYHISFRRDEPYLNCINDLTGHPLRFDFIINDKSGVYIVEYDGLQHFKSAPMWDKNGDLEERKRRDLIKNRWCSDNKIPLIRIPYTHLGRLSIDDLRVETSNFLVE